MLSIGCSGSDFIAKFRDTILVVGVTTRSD